jgi:fumarylacetoacetase
MSTTCIVPISSDSDFSLDNLPYGVFATSTSKTGRIGVAIGNQILDLSKVSHLFGGELMKDHQVLILFGHQNFVIINAKPYFNHSKSTKIFAHNKWYFESKIMEESFP